MAEPIFPAEQRERQAVSSLAGYAYQLYVSALEWMEIGAGGILLLEVAEDYATLVDNVLSMRQVKNSTRPVTLLGKGPVDAITSLWQHREANWEVECRLTYLTTSTPARERDFTGPARLSAIEYWAEAAAGADPAPLRALLSTLGLPADLQAFLESANDERLRAHLLRPLTWACGQPSLGAVRGRLEERLADRAVDRHLVPDDGKGVLAPLLEAVLLSIVQGDRQLTRAGFEDVFQDAATVRASRTEMRRLSMMDGAGGPASRREPFSMGAHPQPDAPPPLDEKVLRIAAHPFAHPRPRPVNLLMTLGVSRRAAIAVTTGLDAATLLERLRVVEAMVERAPRMSFARRVWEASDGPGWSGLHGGRGLIWSPRSVPPSQMDLIGVMAGGFQDERPACGDVLILVLPLGTEAAAADLAARIEKAGAAAAGGTAAEAVPIFLWSGEAPADGKDTLLARLNASLEVGAGRDRHPAVVQASRLRLHMGGAPLGLWRAATGDSLRLHDMSLLCGGDADSPRALDEERAIALVNEAATARQLLYALAFLPVSADVVAALARADDFTRAVSGLVTPEEGCSARPPWQIHQVEGFQPGRYGSFLADHAGGD